jgi:phosphatidylethanolamine/phosphatidyl-N-methylethanolamine N-methyltransferase
MVLGSHRHSISRSKDGRQIPVRRMTAKGETLPFAEEWRFLRRVIANPRHVGAVAPSSPFLGRAIAQQIDPAKPGQVLELGPGTGAVTQAILARGITPSRLTVVEYDPHFAALITRRFPGVDVIRGDAFDLQRTLGESRPHHSYAAVVSGIPLLNFPLAERTRLVEAALACLAPHAPFILFSYGRSAPVSAPKGARLTRAAFVWRNLPPANVWIYRR